MDINCQCIFYYQTVYSSMLLFSFYWGHKEFYKMRTRKGNLCQNFARMHFIIQFPIPSIASFQCTLFDWTFHCIQSHWIDLIMVGSQFCSDVPSTRPAWSKCQASIWKCSTIFECREVQVSSDLYQQRELLYFENIAEWKGKREGVYQKWILKRFESRHSLIQNCGACIVMYFCQDLTPLCLFPDIYFVLSDF